MRGHVVRFASRADSLKQHQAAELRQLVLRLEDEAPTAVRQLLAVVDRHTAATKGWSFVMLSPDQNRTVVRWINANAKRPRISAELWAEFFCHMRMDTGEIVMTRQEMATAAGTTLNNVSTALSELASVGALIRHQDGHAVQWFMNPKIGTCLTGKAREDAQKAAPRLSVVAIT
jgi:predicted transcriptional regulator